MERRIDQKLTTQRGFAGRGWVELISIDTATIPEPRSALRDRCAATLRTRGWHEAAPDFARWIDGAAHETPESVLAALLDARRRDDPIRAADLLDGLAPDAPVPPGLLDATGRQRASALDPDAEADVQEEALGALGDVRVVFGPAACPLATRWAREPGVRVWGWEPHGSLPDGVRALAPNTALPDDASVWIHPALGGDDRETAMRWRARIRNRARVEAASPDDSLRVLVVIGPRPFHVEAPLVDSLRTLGVATAVARVHGDARDDAVADAIAAAHPDRVICVNGSALVRSPVVRATLAAHGIATVCWFVDEPDAALGDARSILAEAGVLALSWEREAVARLRRAGFQGAAYLPHGTRWAHPVPPIPGVGDLLWVGTSYAGDDRRDLHAGAAGPLPERWRDAARRLESERGLSLAALRTKVDGHDPTARVRQLMIGDAVAAQRRGDVARALLPLGLKIFGDREGWTRLLGPHAALCDDVDAATVFPRLVGGSRVSVDCVHPQMPTAVTQRVFDVPACGGLVLADDRADLREHMEVGREVLAYESPAHAVELARWALEHPRARDAMAAAARRRVAAEHTLVHRARRLLRLADAHFGRS